MLAAVGVGLSWGGGWTRVVRYAYAGTVSLEGAETEPEGPGGHAGAGAHRTTEGIAGAGRACERHELCETSCPVSVACI